MTTVVEQFSVSQGLEPVNLSELVRAVTASVTAAVVPVILEELRGRPMAEASPTQADNWNHPSGASPRSRQQDLPAPESQHVATGLHLHPAAERRAHQSRWDEAVQPGGRGPLGRERPQRGGPQLGHLAYPLTDREWHILHYLPTHLSLVEIASELYVSPNTVKSHAAHIYTKLGAHSRTQAVELASALGLLGPRLSFR